MPQLDTITYLSQLFWTFIVFAVFYAMMVKHILPAISTSIKVRKKKLSSIGSLSSDLGDEKVTTVSLFEQMLGSSLGTSRELLSSTVDQSTEWQSASSQNLNESDLKSANSAYVSSLGSISGRVSLTSALTKNANWDDKSW
jgi:F-type H+-transporting ATPase subunit b